MHPRMLLAALATRACWWLRVNLSPTSAPRWLILLSCFPKPVQVHGVVPPQVQDPALVLVGLHQVTLRQLSSLSRSRRMAAQPSGVSATSPSFVLSAKLLRVRSVPSSGSLMKKLNKTGPSTDSWGTSLAAGLQSDSALLVTAL